MESIFDFKKLSNWKYANPRICVFSLPEVENWFQKQFWHEKVHISILEKKFGSVLMEGKKIRKWISHCIFKNGFVRCRGLFSHLRAENWYNGSYVCPEEPKGGETCCLRNHPFIPSGYHSVVYTLHNVVYTVSVLGWEEGYTVKYTPPSEGVPKGTPEGGGVYLTVYPKLSPNTDIISF